jgi:hypothetical protein
MEVREEFGIEVIAIAGLDDLISWLEKNPGENIDIGKIRQHRKEYGC